MTSSPSRRPTRQTGACNRRSPPQMGGAQTVLYDLLTRCGLTVRAADPWRVSRTFLRSWASRETPRSFGLTVTPMFVPIRERGATGRCRPLAPEIKDALCTGAAPPILKIRSCGRLFYRRAIDFVRDTPPDGSIVLAITGDEESRRHRTHRALLDYMKDAGRADGRLSGWRAGTCPNF